MYKPGKPIYKKAGGSVIIFDGFDENGLIMGHVKDHTGEEFPTMYVDAILARGYWEKIDTKSDE